MSLSQEVHFRLSHAALLRGLRRLVTDGGVCVESPLTAYDRAGRWDWFAHEWTARVDWPRGAGKHSLSDWVVLALESDEIPDSLALLRHLAPGPLQRVAALVVGRTEGAGVTATVWDRGEWRSPDLLEVVGAEGDQWRPDPAAGGVSTRLPGVGTIPEAAFPTRPPDPVNSHPVNSQPVNWPTQTDRRSRTLRALPTSCAGLDALHVAVVGLGRLGLLVAQGLAGLVGRLTLIDHDRVGRENLDAMPLATERDVGRLKVEVATEALLANRGDLAIYAVSDECRAPSVQRMVRERRFDLLVTCVDERGDSARLLAARWAREQLIPHLDVGSLIDRDSAGARQLTGDVRLFEPGGLGCAVCCPPLSDEAMRRARRELASPPGSLPPGPHWAWWQTRLGSLFHWNAVVSGVALETWLRFRGGETPGSTWTRIRWTAGHLTPEFHTSRLTLAAGCDECRG